MNFTELCQPFYNTKKAECVLSGKGSQHAIVEFLFESALGKRKYEFGVSQDECGRYFRGTRNPDSELWNLVYEVFDEKCFIKAVVDKIKVAKLPEVFEKFKISLDEREVPDAMFFSVALAKQLKQIAKENGEAKNILDVAYREAMRPAEFPNYIKAAEYDYSHIKTLLYMSEKRYFDDFFVCNTIRTEPYRFMRRSKTTEKIIEGATLEKLAEKDRYIILMGMGGMGKSMMMRHLFLESVRTVDKSRKFPIFVTLREYGEIHHNLFEMVVDSVSRYDDSFTEAHLHSILKEGGGQILLDGLDEIKHSDLDSFERQLERFIIRYPNNQYVMSTRQFSTFVSLSRFSMLWIEPFSHNQALELVDKIDFCSDSPELKVRFRYLLENEYFSTHKEFVSNPLLLTIMMMTYSKHSGIPDKKSIFYAEAYQTLVRRHDNEEKLSYKRAFRSVKEPGEFTNIFREFCGKSYRRGDFKFSQRKFEEYFEKLQTVERMDSDILTAENFLFDVCHSVCIMYEEGRTFSFLHRSFQEYLFADYYSRADDKILLKVKDSIKKPDSVFFNDGNAFDMLYEFEPQKTERAIIIPFLKEIFDAEDSYLEYLRLGYYSVNYFVAKEEAIKKYPKLSSNLVKRRMYNNEPSTVILLFVLKQLDIEPRYTLVASNSNMEYEEAITDIFLLEEGHNAGEEKSVGLFSLPYKMYERRETNDFPFFSRIVKSDDEEPFIFGYEYEVRFEDVINNKDRYSAIIEIMSQESNEVKQSYNRVKEYYERLSKECNRHEDEDDF